MSPYDSSIHVLVADNCRVHIDDIVMTSRGVCGLRSRLSDWLFQKSVDECQIPRYYRSQLEEYEENMSNGYGVEDGKLLRSSRARLVERKFHRPAKRRTERCQKPKETLRSVPPSSPDEVIPDELVLG